MVRRIFFTLFLALMGATASAQEFVKLPPRPDYYDYELRIATIGNKYFGLITPANDSVLIMTKTFYSNEIDSDLGNCANTSINPERRKIEMVKLEVMETGHPEAGAAYQLEKPGESIVPNKKITLSSGEIFVLREVYKRRYECGIEIYFQIIPPRR